MINKTAQELIKEFYNQPRRMSSPVQRADTDSRKVKGYGVVFNQRTTLYDDGEYKIEEIITPESVEGILSTADVRSEYNHDKNMLLGRTSSGTLSLRTDENGVHYEVDVPNTSYGNDLLELVDRRDITGSSFQAMIPAEGIDIERVNEKHLLMRVTKMSRFIEIGPVYSPAYQQTTAQRSQEKMMELFEAAKPQLNIKGDEVARAETLRAHTLRKWSL